MTNYNPCYVMKDSHIWGSSLLTFR